MRRQFAAETERLAGRTLAGIQTAGDWAARRGELRRQLSEMLGLWPMPARTELRSDVTGRSEHDGFVVENVQFQSRPGLYVTANLYRPSRVTEPLPAILYLSGHGAVISNGVSYGNKVAYQHHGAWFARNGYVCLVVDSVQLGEIQGLHHGTYRENLWWWNARGYSPAGAEAWNCIRALDYLSTRPEVDTNRFGVTGRSGGGAYSWWVAALDDRIRAAAPVAGITDLRNHVVDGTVEGHCDCMFPVNTHRWDFPQVAALVAPRPLLIVNTDADTIFPLDGVQRLHARVRDIYRLENAADRLGLVIAPGPHHDTQDLQVPVFRWFNRHLKGVDPVIEMAAVPLCTPEQLRVFRTLPADAINTNLHETFVPAAAPAPVAASGPAWQAQRARWMAALREQSFAGWPEAAPLPTLTRLWTAKRDGVRLEAYELQSEDGLPLRVYAAQAAGNRRVREITLQVLGDAETARSGAVGGAAGNSGADVAGGGVGRGVGAPADASVEGITAYDPWLAALSGSFAAELKDELAAVGKIVTPDAAGLAELTQGLAANGRILVWFAPRGIGLTAWGETPKHRIQVRRRFMLLGQTLDSMRVWDIRRAVQAVRGASEWRGASLTLRGSGVLAADALYAALFEAGVARLELWRLPASHRDGPDYLNVLKVLDVPQALAMSVEQGTVVLRATDGNVAGYARETMRRLGWSRERLVAGP